MPTRSMQLGTVLTRSANDARAAPLQDTAAMPLALARIRLANEAAPLRFASGETQGELDFVSAAMQGVRYAQARR